MLGEECRGKQGAHDKASSMSSEIHHRQETQTSGDQNSDNKDADLHVPLHSVSGLSLPPRQHDENDLCSKKAADGPRAANTQRIRQQYAAGQD